MLRAALAGVCLLGACGGDAPAPEAMPPEPLRLPCALAADGGRAHAFRMTLEHVLDDAASAGPHAITALFAEAPGTMTDLFGLATRRDPVRLDTVVTCPDAPFLLGSGVVTDLVVGLATAVETEAGRERDDDLRSVVLRGAYADWSDGWRVHLTPPRDVFAGMRVLHTRAEVRASIARRWAAADVRLDVLVDDDRLVLTAPPIEAAVVERDAPLHTGFRLIDVTVDGRPADVVLGAGGYLVIGGLRPGVAQVRLRYGGALPVVGENQAEARVLELHRWLPTVPYGAPAPVDVTVHHPAGDALVVSLGGALEPARPAPAGWVAERRVGLTDRDPSIVLLDASPVAHVWRGEGAEVEILASPPVPVEGCAPALARIARALAPFGPLGRVRLVAVPAVYGRHGRRADDLVLLLRAKLVELCTPLSDAAGADLRQKHAEVVALVAHELAHGWFGRRVRAADDEASAWWEAVSEYVSTWAIDDVAATELRRGWLDDYAETAHRDLFAMASRIPTAGNVRDVLSYDKGALLLAALEQQIGRERVAAVLRHLIARRGGELGSWLDVVAATHEVAGSAASTWLHRWLFAVGAPELAIADLRRRGPVLAFAITQDADPPFDATVEVAAYDGDRLLVSARVPMSGRRTEVVLPAPPRATRVVVDPFYRLPRFGITEAALAR